MASRHQTLWIIARPCDLRWRAWDDQLLVFDAASGDTHLLNRVAGEALRCLEQPADAARLAQRVAASVGVSPDGGFLDQMADLLDELAELGLICAVPR